VLFLKEERKIRKMSYYIIVNLNSFKKLCEYAFANFEEANAYAKEYLELQDYSIIDTKSYESLRKRELQYVAIKD
jgi:hypothetical protein